MRAGARPVASGAVSTPSRRRIPSVPETLRVVSTTRKQHCAGSYRLVPEQQANGMPVWKYGKKWLYSSPSGKWFINNETDHVGVGKDFAAASGHIYCPDPHGGLMPNEVTRWKSWGDDKWRKDTGVSVTSDRDNGAAEGALGPFASARGTREPWRR
eukprot:gene19761-biopygen28993